MIKRVWGLTSRTFRSSSISPRPELAWPMITRSKADFSTSARASSLSPAHSSFHEDRTVDTTPVTGESEQPTTSTVFYDCGLSWVMSIASRTGRLRYPAGDRGLAYVHWSTRYAEWRFPLVGEPVRDKARESRSYQCPTMYRCNRCAARNAASQNPITDDPTVTTSLPANRSFGTRAHESRRDGNRPKSQINRTTKPA